MGADEDKPRPDCRFKTDGEWRWGIEIEKSPERTELEVPTTEFTRNLAATIN